MHFYRIVMFGKPEGPWRRSTRLARLDAIEKGVGSFDEDRRFWLSAGAEIESIHEYELTRTDAARPAWNTRIPGQGSSLARARA